MTYKIQGHDSPGFYFFSGFVPLETVGTLG